MCRPQEAFSDPEFVRQVRGFGAVLRVRERSVPVCDAARRSASHCAGENDLGNAALVAAARRSVSEFDCETDLGDAELVVRGPDGDDGIEDARSVPAATAGVSERITGLLERNESDCPSLSNSVNSCLGLSTSACARASRFACAAASAGVCLGSSPSAEFAAVVHAHASPLHGALQVVLVTSCLCRGPPVTAWTCVAGSNGHKEGQRWGFWSGRRFAPCLRGVGSSKFSAGRLCAGQVVGHFPRQPGADTRRAREGAVTPSLHPEVPDTQFVSPGRGLGWMKVCDTAQSGIWVLKGDARARMLPATLDHIPGGMDEAGDRRDRLGHARARLSMFTCVWT